MDVRAFVEELENLKTEITSDKTLNDFKHLKKIERWGKLCSIIGYSTAWIAPNPFSALLLSQGKFCRWTILGHHVLHQGYDSVLGIPKKYTSSEFAKGPRRLLDWFDWIHPDAWKIEHNSLHHYYLGEDQDPDLLENEIKGTKLGPTLRHLSLFLFSFSWKALFYAPSTIKQLQRFQRKAKPMGEVLDFEKDINLFNPMKKEGRDLWRMSWLPYALLNFFVVPALFIIIGPFAVFSVFINLFLAELITNFHGFITIVSNHAGEDLFRFNLPIKGRGEFYLRQIMGSTNYTCGGDLNDFLHGWLNYQIEHHLWPNLTLRQYQCIQPKVKALCEKYGVPYVQESIYQRAIKMIKIYNGKAKMRVINNAADFFA